MPIQLVSEWTNFFCSIDSENAKKCLQSNSAFAILTLRDGDGGETSPRAKVARCRNRGASRTSTEHGKLQAAQPESGCSTKAKAQRESRRRQGNCWNDQITTGHTGLAGVVTAQRSVTSAQGFSVQPTTKLDGDQRIAMKFSLTPRGKPWGEKRLFLKLRHGEARRGRAMRGVAWQG